MYRWVADDTDMAHVSEREIPAAIVHDVMLALEKAHSPLVVDKLSGAAVHSDSESHI